MAAFTLLISTLITSSYSGDWGYDNGELNWVSEYPECGSNHQSPIDLTISEGTSKCDEPILLEWTSELRHFAIRNNGHSLQAMPFDVDHSPGGETSGLSILNHRNETDIILKNTWYNTYKSPVNERYCFDSMHFHWGSTSDVGSEHTINGEAFPLEVHMVHFSCDYVQSSQAQQVYASGWLDTEYDDDNVLAVVSVLFEIGEANPVLEDILNDIVIDGIEEYHTPDENYGTHLLKLYYSDYDMAGLLPDNLEIIGYEGSLTTPPCYETIRWNILRHTNTVSEEQMEKFRLLLESTNSSDYIAPNFREVKGLNGRVIDECMEDLDARAVTKSKKVVDEDDGVSVQGDDTWFIIGVVFICLFGVALLVIMYLSYINWAYGFKKEEKERKERGEYKQVGSVEVGGGDTNDGE